MFKLFAIEHQDSTGVWRTSKWAKGGTGYIIYDGRGHMAVQITPKNYSDFKWIKEESTIDEDALRLKTDTMSMTELKEAVMEFASNYVYFANYEINDSLNTITHHLLSSTVPSIWDTSKTRDFQFRGDTIILKVQGVNRRLKWIRVD